MLSDKIRTFLEQTHRGVVTSFRKDGAVQLSIVSCGPYKDGVAFTVTSTRSKLWNLKRDPRCSILVSNENWWGFVVIEGHADIISADNSSPCVAEADAFEANGLSHTLEVHEVGPFRVLLCLVQRLEQPLGRGQIVREADPSPRQSAKWPVRRRQHGAQQA